MKNIKRTAAAGRNRSVHAQYNVYREQRKERKRAKVRLTIVILAAMVLLAIAAWSIGFRMGQNSVEPFQPVELESFEVRPSLGDGALDVLLREAEKYAEETGYEVSTESCALDIRVANAKKEIRIYTDNLYNAYPILVGNNKVDFRIDFLNPAH